MTAPARGTTGPAVAPVVWMQCLMLAALVIGEIGGFGVVSLIAAGLAVATTVMQWPRLLPQARLFFALAAAGAGAVVVLAPQAIPQLRIALLQGVGFGALMMVLGLLRQPVRRAAITRAAAEYLLSFGARGRFAAILSGSHFMSLMFNIGIIAMIGDLVHAGKGPEARTDPPRRAVVLAAMRGAALATVWSPIGLGFAIVTAGIPGIPALPFMVLCFGFTLAAMALSALRPMLPAEASGRHSAAPVTTAGQGSPKAVAETLAVSALLLGLAILLHQWLEVSFTIVSVFLLPVFSFIWLALESRSEHGALAPRLCNALTAMGDLRSESAIFMSANVIGACLSIAVQASPLWGAIQSGGFAGLPVLLACLVIVPLVAACYLPNSIVVVMAVQLLGPTPLGQDHPMALGLTLAVSWAMAIGVSPISAMTLISGAFCAVPPRRIAWGWNVPFVVAVTALAAVAVTLVYLAGW